jgi:hypothetical protein
MCLLQAIPTSISIFSSPISGHIYLHFFVTHFWPDPADENSRAEANLADALVRMALEGGISYLTCVDVTWVVGDVTCLNKQLI